MYHLYNVTLDIFSIVFCYVGYISSDVFKEMYVWEHDISPDASIARLQELVDFVEISKCIHDDGNDDMEE